LTVNLKQKGSNYFYEKKFLLKK